MHTLKTIIRNKSAWPIDVVWENAQDLEHVATLHGRTNYSFQLLDVRRSKDARLPYESLIFAATRRMFGLLPVTSFGFRRIVGEHEIWQMDVSPLLRLTTALRSTLERDPEDPEKTILVDYVTITVPSALKPLGGLIVKALERHTRLQCEEDETFRARRVELKKRGINLRPSILATPAWERDFGRD
jgi:hypothetical protein